MPHRLFSCACLGDKWFGKDVDTLFAYSTPHVGVIKDRSLGLMKMSLMLCIFIYIVIFNIFYKGNHFKIENVNGIARLQLQQPTRDCNPMYVDCRSNFSSLEALPYCKQYSGAEPLNAVSECKYFDSLELPIQTPNGILLPTYKEHFEQTRLCSPSAENGFTCDRKYGFIGKDGEVQSGHHMATSEGSFYVADFEDFTLLFDHSFRTPSGLQFDDFKMQGYWMDCHGLGGMTSGKGKIDHLSHVVEDKLKSRETSECVKRPIACNHKMCKDLHMKETVFQDRTEKQNPSLMAFMRGSRTEEAIAVADANAAIAAGEAAADSYDASLGSVSNALALDMEPRVEAIKYGDVMSLGTMLAMADRSLDEEWKKGGDGEWQSLRSRGGALVVEIEYHNMVPWTVLHPQDPPEYTLSVSSRPVYKYKEFTVEKKPDGGRSVQEDYGILVIVRQSGQLGVLDITKLLIVMTTSLGLLAVSNTLTDLIAFNLMPKKDEYKKFKFTESDDFHPEGSKPEKS